MRALVRIKSAFAAPFNRRSKNGCLALLSSSPPAKHGYLTFPQAITGKSTMCIAHMQAKICLQIALPISILCKGMLPCKKVFLLAVTLHRRQEIMLNTVFHMAIGKKTYLQMSWAPEEIPSRLGSEMVWHRVCVESLVLFSASLKQQCLISLCIAAPADVWLA